VKAAHIRSTGIMVPDCSGSLLRNRVSRSVSPKPCRVYPRVPCSEWRLLCFW